MSQYRNIVHRLCLSTTVLVSMALLGSSAFADSFYYEATQTAVSETKKKDQNEQIQWRVRGWINGDSAKIEFLDSMSPIFPKGSYMLTTDGGESMTLVDPKEKTYSDWDLEALFASFGAIMEGMDGLVNLDFSDLSSETLVDEAGPEVLGYPTRHVQYRTGHTMKMKAMGMKREWSVRSTNDVWVTTAIDAPGMFVWLKNAPSTGDEEFDQMIQREMNRVEGLALKVESVSILTDKKGREQESRSSMKVDLLREEKIPASTFEVPAAFSKVEAEDDPTGAGALSSIFGRKSGS